MKAASVPAQQAQVNTSLTVVAQAGSLVTLEMLLYGVIVLIAAVLRFFNLNAAPLMPFEAAQAWAAWNGSPLPAGGSPLFYTLNQILFGVLGSSAGDAGVRIGAAVIGTGMVLLPALYRKQIGRYGALAASAMLAISPTLVLASRSLDGQIVAAACALAAIGFGLRYIDSPNRNTLIALSIAIGLALTSGPGIVTILIIIAPALFVSYRWIASDADRAQLQQVRQDSHVIRTVLIWGGATFVLISTALMLRPTSFASVPEMFSAWIAAWGGNNTVSALRLFQILLIYEPLIVWSGLAGLIIGLRRISATVVLLSVWALGALIVALLQPGRQPLDLVLMLTPLALLGGMAIEVLANALARHGSWKVEGLFWLVTTPVIGYLAITSGSYAVGHALLGNAHLFGENLNPFTSYVILLAISAIVLSGIFVIAIGWHATARAAAVTLICGFSLISFGNAWGVTQVRPGDPRELLWGPVSTSAEIRAMVQAIEAASKRQTGFSDRGLIAMDLSQDDPLLQWYLRDFRNIKSGISEHESAPIMIAPPGSALPPLQGSYAGKQFPIRLTWEPSTLSEQALLRWWLYRESDQPPNPLQSEVLWVRVSQ